MDYKQAARSHEFNKKHGSISSLINKSTIDSFEAGYEFCKKEYEEKLRWIPVEEKVPEASPDKNDWWTSDIGEVFPYSKKCIVENDEGEFFINNYSVIENCWGTFCGTIGKWRFL